MQADRLIAAGCLVLAVSASICEVQEWTRFRGPNGSGVRYVRPSEQQFVTECEFTVRHEDGAWAIKSVTERKNCERV